MITTDIAKSVLFDPLEMDVNELYIISGYATPKFATSAEELF